MRSEIRFEDLENVTAEFTDVIGYWKAACIIFVISIKFIPIMAEVVQLFLRQFVPPSKKLFFYNFKCLLSKI
jgi:hypothetical protein